MIELIYQNVISNYKFKEKNILSLSGNQVLWNISRPIKIYMLGFFILSNIEAKTNNMRVRVNGYNWTNNLDLNGLLTTSYYNLTLSSDIFSSVAEKGVIISASQNHISIDKLGLGNIDMTFSANSTGSIKAIMLYKNIE
jgi:hypothetical protein